MFLLRLREGKPKGVADPTVWVHLFGYALPVIGFGGKSCPHPPFPSTHRSQACDLKGWHHQNGVPAHCMRLGSGRVRKRFKFVYVNQFR